MGRKFWRVSSFDKKQAAAVAYEYGFDELAVLLLNSRGITEPEDIAEFLENLPEINDPFLIKDMDKAVDCIRDHIAGGKRIAVYGDYDADGVTATALLYMYLETIGADVMYYIPSRMEEGYGLHKDAVDMLYERGVKLIITVDNGINSVEEAKYIRSKNIRLVITDHHQPGEKLPEAAAVVDPHRADDTSPFKDLAGVGVAFKLVSALEDGDWQTVLDDFADIIAIGTIADIVPLHGENRTLAVKGIEQINEMPRTGIEALKINAGFGEKDFTSTNIAFTIAPRINAAGRIESALTALKLILSESYEESKALADKLDNFNQRRQETEAVIAAEAIRKIEENDKLKYSKVIVVDGEGWHSGVIGIVASKLVDRYGRPAMVIAKEKGQPAKGSCRSIEGFSLFDALTSAGDTLVRFGGHTLAAGFTIEEDKIDEFREKINAYAEALPAFYPVMNLDCKLLPESVNLSLIESLSCLEPFGAENPQPVFGFYKLTIRAIRPLGTTGKHIRLQLERNGTTMSAVYFGMSEERFPYAVGDVVDIAATVDKNEFRGEVKTNVYVKAVKDSAADDDMYFKSVNLYNKVKSKATLSESERRYVCPDRRFAASVFRFIKNAGRCNLSPEQIALRMGFRSEVTCRVNIVLDAFCELGLIEYKNGVYSAVDNAKKVSLGSSEILRSLGYAE